MPRGWLAATLACTGVAGVVAAISYGARGRGEAEMVRPPVVARPEVVLNETADTLRRGETVSHLFVRHGVRIDLTKLDSTVPFDPRRLHSGLVFSFGQSPTDSIPSQVIVRTDPEHRITFQRTGARWNTVAEQIVWKAEPARIEGGIDNSLYLALDAQVPDAELDAGNRQRLAWDLADVYAWQVDFTRDIQPGDRFEVLFERLVNADGEIRFGKVLASDLTMSGKHLTAFRFDSGGRTAYYDSAGNSLRRAFLRAPVQFRRISSSFARARYHPILGISRRHEGTDYAADPGTPVMAAGDGVVARAGWAGGYGNLIEIRHRSGIVTRYGHLRGFARGIHSGTRVAQGQVIGYVGSTGLATGPHLHYEFRVNGAARDSRRVSLGDGDPITPNLRPIFYRERDRLEQGLTAAGYRAEAGSSGPEVTKEHPAASSQ
jgi:murein DD-endopeptidase MepM/ murein hydrolase activator NlpD